jgi:hypothetical protein
MAWRTALSSGLNGDDVGGIVEAVCPTDAVVDVTGTVDVVGVDVVGVDVVGVDDVDAVTVVDTAGVVAEVACEVEVVGENDVVGVVGLGLASLEQAVTTRATAAATASNEVRRVIKPSLAGDDKSGA